MKKQRDLPCILCHGKEVLKPYPKLVHIVKCSGCGLVFQVSQPETAELKALYSENYFVSESSKSKGYDNYLGDEINILKSFEKRLDRLRRFIATPGKLVDVGCATGFFLKAASKRGWQVQGIEISEFAASRARELGYSVFCGSLGQYDPPSAKCFDALSMWDVIEHMPNPLKDLERANSLLRQGGLLLLTTPAIDSLPAFVFRERWMGFKENEHLFFFSKPTLKKLLEKAGFKLRYWKFEGKYISFDLFRRRIGCYSKAFSSFLRKYIPFKGRDFNFYINPFDIYFVVAQKVREVEGETISDVPQKRDVEVTVEMGLGASPG